MTEPLTVSVIVCTRDRPDDFARLLPSLLASKRQPLEIIVVDQSSSDATQSILLGASDSSTRLRYVRTTSRGLSRARNEAIRLAVGDVCAFTDDDCTVAPDWIDWLHAVFESTPDLAIAFGKLEPIAHDVEREFVPGFEPAAPLWTRRPYNLLESGVGANMAIRREVFQRLGEFDEDLGAGAFFRSGEDSDFAYRAARSGCLILRDPRGVVVHWGARPWAGGIARRLIFDGYAAIGAVYAKHARHGDWRAIGYLAQVAFATLGQILAGLKRDRKLLGLRRLSALSAGAWTALRFPFEPA